MENLDKEKCLSIIGGLNVSSAIIQAFTSGVKIVLEVGRALGSALRRGGSGNLCKM